MKENKVEDSSTQLLSAEAVCHEDRELTESINFDTILNRIGMGFYNAKVWFIFAFLSMADGAESIVISFIIPVFKNVFNGTYDFNLEATLGTMVYIGFFVGSLFSGFVSDNYGRKKPVIFATVLMTIFCIVSAYPPSVVFFIVFRTLFGMIDGFFSPFSYIYMAEMTPSKHRGKYMSIMSINYITGEVITCLIAIFTLDNFNSGNWHALLLWSALPGIFAFIGSTFFLEESSRYEMIRGRYTSGISLLNKIWKMNKSSNSALMTTQEEKELIQSYKEIKGRQSVEESESKVSIRELFRGKFLKITLFSWFNWFVNTSTYNGVSFILPSVLNKLNNNSNNNNNKSDNFDVGSIIFSCLSEIPTLLIATSIVDTKIFGRKNSMAINFLLGGISSLLASIQFYPGLIFWISAAKSFFSMAWTLNYQFTSELYPTAYRGRGLGLASTVGKFGSIVMPGLCALLFDIGTLVPFVLFGIVSILASICTYAMPYDTAGLEVHKVDELS